MTALDDRVNQARARGVAFGVGWHMLAQYIRHKPRLGSPHRMLGTVLISVVVAEGVATHTENRKQHIQSILSELDAQ